jgi:hypothetical protein
VEAIRGIGRVLRPGGKFIFFEDGLAPERRVQRWQQWSEPIPHWLLLKSPMLQWKLVTAASLLPRETVSLASEEDQRT